MRDPSQQYNERARIGSTLSPSLRRGIVAALLAAGGLLGSQSAFAQESGQQIFQKACAGCHSIGAGRLVGPDLAGVTDKRPEAWLIKLIRSSEALVKAGDKDAKALFEEFKMHMPDQSLSDDQIRKVLAHIKGKGADAAATKPAPAQAAAAAVPPDPNQVQLGQDLFEGKVRLAKGGPSCNACHDVRNDKVASGGILAAELSLVFSRMGKQGVQSVIASAPFPAMQVAYNGKDLTETEIAALVAFLQHVEKEHAQQLPRSTGLRMFSAGVGGVIVLLGIFSLAGRRRKNRSVNQDIYDRQLRSE